MKTITANVLLPCAPEVFWRVYLDPAYLRAVYLGELGYKAFDVLEVTDSTRKLRVVPRVNVPGPIESLIGESFAYEDHGTLDRAANVWTWSMVQPKPTGPHAKPKREVVTTRGTVRVVATGERACRRTDELVIESKIFGVGGLIESSAEKEARAAWAKEFAFLTRWIEKLGT